MLIDEIDKPMFGDLETYRKHTAYKNLKVIGLTATACD